MAIRERMFEMVMDFRKDLEQVIEVLRRRDEIEVTVAEIQPPCETEEILKVQESLKYPPGEKFLDYYRSTNGARLEWKSEHERGGFSILPLSQVFFTDLGYTFGYDDIEEGENEVPFLGGMDDTTLRKKLRTIDSYQIDFNGYPTVALFTSPEHSEPLVLFPNDACVDLCSNHPMLATTYFEMLLATCGHSEAVYDFTDRGWEGDFEPITWERAQWATLGGPNTYLNWLDTRTRAQDNYAPAMAKLHDVLKEGVETSSLSPKRWLELRYGVQYPL